MNSKSSRNDIFLGSSFGSSFGGEDKDKDKDSNDNDKDKERSLLALLRSASYPLWQLVAFILALVFGSFYLGHSFAALNKGGGGESGLSLETAATSVKCSTDSSSSSSSYSPTKLNYADLDAVKLDASACPQSELWGSAHQGGWKVCALGSKSKGSNSNSNSNGNSNSKCLVYSFGLGADWTFDNAAEALGCEVHGFDPTGPLWQQGMYGRDYTGINYHRQYPSSGKFFHNWGLGPAGWALIPPRSAPQEWPGLGDPPFSYANPSTWLLKNLQQTMLDLGHITNVDVSGVSSSNSISIIGPSTSSPNKPPWTDYSSGPSVTYIDSALVKEFGIGRTIDILKIDVEGAEWDAAAAFFYSDPIAALLKKGLVRQLLVEWHWDPDSRLRNGRHALLLRRIEELGFQAWNIERHAGSDCCLDTSYVFIGV